MFLWTGVTKTHAKGYHPDIIFTAGQRIRIKQSILVACKFDAETGMRIKKSVYWDESNL